MSTSATSATRRQFLKSATLAGAGLGMFPYISRGGLGVSRPLTRSFGRCAFEVTTLGLGGQASIQWTPADVDPVAIIVKAHQAGINYFDTSNVYGPSQLNFGKAFRELGLVPGTANYQEKRRRAVFLTSKTGLRWSKGGDDAVCRRGFSMGLPGSHAMDDVRRSLSQIFGDNAGAYPAGAYLDMVLIHSLTRLDEINGLYAGLDDTSPDLEHIGALAGLRDLRDGTNLTGLNPQGERLIRHIGFSGHFSPPVMMEMIRRDSGNLLDGLLVAVNSNDPLCANMQHNVLPLAKARDIGVIAMKVFADGALYGKEARFSRAPEDVIRTVGSGELPSRPLVQYALTTPGVATAIIGTGHISADPKHCQLVQNLSAAQVARGALGMGDRRAIEGLTATVKDGKTNYFQDAPTGLTAPANARLQVLDGGTGRVALSWETALAGDAPITHYEIERDGKAVRQVPYAPQLTAAPFSFEDTGGDLESARYRIIAVDGAGRRAATAGLAAGQESGDQQGPASGGLHG